MSNTRAGQGEVVVVRGEAGIGKTALLDYIAEHAPGFRNAKVIGVESEMEMAFGGLHQLCVSMLDHLGRLPGPQRDALGTAFGLSSGPPPDRFLVGLAVLSLLAEVAEARPLICLIDDVQWLDQVSTQTLAFVARRLQMERVAIVFAVREPGVVSELRGLPDLAVQGLSDDDARALLKSAIPGRLDERVRDRIVAETHGNPLALLELPRGLSGADLAGGFALPDASPLASQIEESLLRRVRALPSDTQRFLLVAAAEPVGDVSLLRRAAERLGIGTEAATPAQESGLIDLDARLRFRHPLVRSAAYRAAGLSDRQKIHHALAEATDPHVDPDRRAWHRAHSAVGPDEAVAGELEQSAGRAQTRGGVAAAAAFLERATALTADPRRRGARSLAAAQAKFDAAAMDAASELLATAELCPLNDVQRARLLRLKAQIVFARTRGSEATPLFLIAAQRLKTLDNGSSREAYLEALGAAIFAGRLSGHPSLHEAAAAAHTAPPAPHPPQPMDFLLDGVATRFTKGYRSAVRPLTKALQGFRREALRSDEDLMGWLWLACPVAPEPIAPELWDDETWHELATRAVQLAREAGALTVLPVALAYRAGVHVHAGEFATAADLLEEADVIAQATGSTPLRYTSLMLMAWRGVEVDALTTIDAAVKDATARGEGRALGLAGYATAILYNGLGQYDKALAGSSKACEHEDLGFFGWSLVELVEAGARSGAREVATQALARLQERTLAAGTDWARGILARSSALLSNGETVDPLYRESIARLERSRIVVHLARAHLLYGEWLRRENRRVEAREQLRTAHEMLTRIGAEAFAERARRELVATGEKVRKRSLEAPDKLTAQEAQIARLAGEGLTNPDIGAQLFISPHTVEWHLRKVFVKLGISSRKQLRGSLPVAGKVAGRA